MPLIPSKSKKAFSKNIKTEMAHGKPQKQALAIAFAVKRKAQKKSTGGMITPKYAEGGEVEPKKTIGEKIGFPGAKKGRDVGSDRKPASVLDAIKSKFFSQGGEVDELPDEELDEYVPNGQVDIEDNAEPLLNYYDELNRKAAHKMLYDLDQLDAQPEDSNEIGENLGDGPHSISLVEKIRRKIRGL